MNQPSVRLHSWLAEPMPADVAKSVARLRDLEDVHHVAIMPDVHLAQEVCVGAVIATTRLIYPAAVGNDIGCGMAALAFDGEASLVRDEQSAAAIFSQLYKYVPTNKHARTRALPTTLGQLSNKRLQSLSLRDGCVQLGTLGRGNHFLEFQADRDDRLWIMIHSGSRAIGQTIAAHHLKTAKTGKFGLKFVDAESDQGLAYLADMEWARSYAAQNRLAMLHAASQILSDLFKLQADWSSLVHCDHNHIQKENHRGADYWIHRKGAQSAAENELRLIPGSMGTASFHVAGRGCAAALSSCSHGAGRKLSRTEARQRVTIKDLSRQLSCVWFDRRQATSLREEAPSAYKDIRAVMRAQRKLVKVCLELEPLLTYKGG